MVILHPRNRGMIALDAQNHAGYYMVIPTPWGGGKKHRVRLVSRGEVAVENSENALRRLKTIEGHLGGVIRMVEDDQYCIDVIRQIQAVESALNKVSAQILENHLNSCVTTAIQGNNPRERQRVLKEISEVFEMSTKV